MIFKIKNDNYKNFDVYKDNVLTPRSYFIPFADPEEMAKTDIRTERYNSSMVQVLSGQWDFKYYDKVSNLPKELDVENTEFDTVSVPSVWQHTGYEPPYYVNTRYQFTPNPPEIPEDCSVGVYHKTFEVDDITKNYILTFLGVAGGLDVFLNENYVGYSEGSHNTAEFELDSFITNGTNHLVVVVHKWTNGTYLECQDMFRCNGIFRDVLLHKYEKNSIYDFEAKTVFNNDFTYNLTVLPSLKLTDECELSASLFDENRLITSKSINVDSKQIDKISFENLSVKEWSAEEPKLYTLIVSLTKDGEIQQLVRRPIGFKHIKITGNVFTFNNKNIKLLGVNHHDTNPKTGYAMTIEDMEQDVKIFKQYNVNCVRTSHYPPDPAFIDLCDEYGIYVVDEADIETHGCEVELHKPGLISHNPLWQNRYWDRVYRMFSRDKNHPSITMWSLGNEAHGYKNQDYCYSELKKLTPIPIHYEAVCRTRRWAYDVVSQMYPFLGRVAKIAKGSGLPSKYYTKPYYMCEYAHAMGLGAGELETYVNAFLHADNMMGGCIWEFADHAIYHDDGPYEYTYGGDHGEWKHDKNFCVDGLFYPNRTPHAGALQMKNCYRPVRCKETSKDKFEFYNYKCFTKADYTVLWSYSVNGIEKQNGEISLDIDPRTSKKYKLDISHLEGDEAVTFTYLEKENVVAKEQILNLENEKEIISSKETTPPTVTTSEQKVIVHFKNGKFVFDTKQGTVENYIVGGVDYVNQSPLGNVKGFGISLYRAPIDNDMYVNMYWKKLALDTEKMYVSKVIKPEKAYSVEDNKVVISYDYHINTAKKKNLVKLTISYKIYNDGNIKVSAICNNSKQILFAPRFGLTFEIPKQYDNVEYFGLGDRQNTSDFREHALLGIYNLKVDEMHEDYIKPQESSMRSLTRFAKLTNEDGKGLEFVSVDAPMTFSADHYTSAQCAKASHREDLLRCDTTYLHFDSYLLGAGSNSCGPLPSKEHKKSNLKGQQITLLIKPI